MIRLPGNYKTPWPWLGLLYAIFAVIARFLPLTGELHYEFSALMGLAVSLLSGLAVVLGREGTEERVTEGSGGILAEDAPVDLWGLQWRPVALSMIPLGIALIGGLFRPNCGVAEGLAWYLLLVPPAAWISSVLGLLSRSVARRRWQGLLLFLGLWSASLFRGAHEAYWGPHIYLYAWQIGFFPGGSWDAELPITARLIIYRAAHLVIAGILLLVVQEFRRTGRERRLAPIRPGVIAVGVSCALLAVACIPFRPQLGLTRTHDWLRAELGDSVRTRYAVIYYNAPTADSLDIWRASLLTDFYITEHAAALGLDLKSLPRVTLYLYSSPAEEKRLVGTSSAAFTKPWLGTLNMPLASVGSTLRHELAHIMFAPFGNPLGISLSQGLLEGSAVALENETGWRTLHQYARDLYAYGMAPPVEQIMSVGGFSSRRASLSYVLAGSFSQWLISRYGIDRYLAAYPWGDFDGAYGRSLHNLSEEYRGFIDSLPSADSTYRPTMQYLFGGGSFFLQKCLRRIGTLNARGFEALEERRYDRALENFRGSLDEGITYSARAGILRALSGKGGFGEMLDSSAVYASDTASFPLLPLLVEQGDAHWGLGDTSGARRLYDSILGLDIGLPLSTRAALRLWFLDTPDTVRSLMRVYFTVPMGTLQRYALLTDAFNRATGDDGAILAMMRAALTANTSPRTTIERLAEDLLATSPARYEDTSARPGRLRVRAMLASTLEDLRIYAAYVRPDLSAILNERFEWYRQGNQEMSAGSHDYRVERKEEQNRLLRYLGWDHPEF